jgi:periplasmic protein TonB
MASPEKIVPSLPLPDTLPEDFGEWDGEGSPQDSPAYSWERELPSAPPVYSWETQAPAAAEHAESDEWAAFAAANSSRKGPKSVGQATEHKTNLSSITDKPHASDSAAYEPVFVEQRNFIDQESEAPAAPKQPETDEWAVWAAANSSRKGPKSAGQSAERKAALSPAADKPYASDSAASAPAFTEQRNSTDHGSEAPAAAKHVETDEWAVWAASHSSRKGPKPLAQPTERKAALSPVVDEPRVSDSTASAPAPGKTQEPASESANGSPSTASRKLQASHATEAAPAAPGRPNFATADEALYQMFSTVKFETKGERKALGKKQMIIAGVSAGSALLLLLLMIPLFHHGSKSTAKQSIQPVLAATDVQPNANTAKPRAGEPLTQDKTTATAATQQATDKQQPSNDADTASSAQTPTETQTQMMNDQLAAPTKIPQGIKAQQVAENEPATPSFGADGLGGSAANPSIFNGRTQMVVKAPPVKPITISSGVAVGMLIQKTPPVYPIIAKTARVSGTVEIEATITKTGTIRDLHAVSGPVMLRQAAVDAVRTWRYQPYKLNNEPTEVETTINVIFTLGG